ncbi:MAG: threonine--tRNA ligase, partial [Euryarchaeota archaeon]|nr:threonine--tRNA ligase [Euryarchaeota archaeon]
MKTLYIHSDYLEFSVKKSTPVAEKITDEQKEGSFGEILVAFISVEKQDERNPEAVILKAVEDLEDVAKRVKCRTIALYPYAHLSSSLGSPSVAIKILQAMEEQLIRKDYEVHRVPFGWYKAFKISCKGHPLSE